MALFGRKHDARPPGPETYHGLRRQILSMTPAGLRPAPAASPLALLMEIEHPNAIVTLVGVADGTTSLYFSNGGALLGSGQHAEVAQATASWLAVGASMLSSLSAVVDPDPPYDRTTQFLAVTPDGVLGARAPERELAAREHALAPLYAAAQDVIAQIRLVETRLHRSG